MFASLPLLSQAGPSQSRDHGPWCPNSSPQQLGEQYTVASIRSIHPFHILLVLVDQHEALGLASLVGKRHGEASRVARDCFPGPWLIAATVGTPSQSCPRSSVPHYLTKVVLHELTGILGQHENRWTCQLQGQDLVRLFQHTFGTLPNKIKKNLCQRAKKKPGYLS